jgi:hypothetical protein
MTAWQNASKSQRCAAIESVLSFAAERPGVIQPLARAPADAARLKRAGVSAGAET